jgi:hypothetical protein
MVTGKNKCPICKKWYSLKRSQSKLKIPTEEFTEITNNRIYDHVCMTCLRKRSIPTDYGYAIKHNQLIWYFDNNGMYERTKFG